MTEIILRMIAAIALAVLPFLLVHFSSSIIGKIEHIYLNYISKFFDKAKHFICAVCSVFLNKCLLFFIAISDIIIWSLVIAVYQKNGQVELYPIITSQILLLIALYIYYDDTFSLWCKKNQHMRLLNIYQKIVSMCFYLCPVYLFLMALYATKGYFYGSTNIMIIFIASFISILLFSKCIVKMCDTLQFINFNVTDLRKKSLGVLNCIFCIIIIFSIIYITIVSIDHSAFSNYANENPLLLSFDFIYFSAMTFMTAGCSITPESILAKLFVLIETGVFVIYISIFLFGLFSNTPKSDE